MRTLLPLLMAIGLGALAWNVNGATPQKKTPAKKTAVKKSVASKSAASKRAPARKRTTTAHKSGSTNTRKTASSRRTPAPRTTWRNRQAQPTAERYKEIQNALVAKGYLQPEEATGVWNDASADGMKNFQSGQNLQPTGKISSLSLIALGLGPKHDSQAPAAVSPPPQQPPGN